MKTMGARIHAKRIELGLTMAELGDKVGVQSSAVNKWEKGEVKYIERSRIAQLAEIFHCSPSWLMGFDSEEDVTLTYESPGKETVTAKVDSTPIMGSSATSKAALYQAALNVRPENVDIAIKLLKSLS